MSLRTIRSGSSMRLWTRWIWVRWDSSQTATTGRRPSHPRDLLKLYIYAYLNQTSSIRRLEKECHRNLEVLWLMKQLTPDFKMIADFRKDNGKASRRVFRPFILFCKEPGLVSGKLVAIDGSKFKAAAGKDQALTPKQRQSMTLGQFRAIHEQAPHFMQIAMELAIVTLQRHYEVCHMFTATRK